MYFILNPLRFDIMKTLVPYEKWTQYAALLFFLFGCLLVLALQFTIGLYYTPHYFVAHFLLGLFLPFFFYSLGGSSLTFWIGIFLTSLFHFGYELWEDQLTRDPNVYDWDQITSGTIGLVIAYIVYRIWNKWYINKKPT